jgi:flavin reductase (DIM6/NTAB) family NADH-FMN oxidoreductase RutF
LASGAPFAINILHRDQMDVANQCAGKIKGEQRFEVGGWQAGALGVPCLAGAQASIVCRNANSLHHGTHTIFVGDVEEVTVDGVPEPLVYMDGKYGRADIGG